MAFTEAACGLALPLRLARVKFTAPVLPVETVDVLPQWEDARYECRSRPCRLRPTRNPVHA